MRKILPWTAIFGLPSLRKIGNFWKPSPDIFSPEKREKVTYGSGRAPTT
jgi:hypothetical protein